MQKAQSKLLIFFTYINTILNNYIINIYMYNILITNNKFFYILFLLKVSSLASFILLAGTKNKNYYFNSPKMEIEKQ